MGGGKSASGSFGALLGRTSKQDKVIKGLVKRTANLKKEQYRIIDSDGNILIESKGDKHSVATTVGEKRENLDGNISLHNHPDGGTFSSADLSDFGYGAKEIVIASPEGTYRLINKKYGTPDAKKGWYDMREKLDSSIPEQSIITLRKQAQANVENSNTTKELKKITNKWDSIRKSKGTDEANKYLNSVKDKYDSLNKKRSEEITQEVRRLETQPFHDFFKQNAKQYGFDYRYEIKP